MIVYGIATCDTCRKSMKALEARAPEWRDIRKQPLTEAECDAFLAAFGDKAINRASTTWRALDAEEKARPARDLLLDHPTLLKRPVIRDGETLHLGWGADVRARLLP